jgi:3-oxoacyl-[acyl-carrier-protein] synthase I
MVSSVYVIGNGARTPLGLLAAPSAAAVRASISSMQEHPFMADRSGKAIVGALDQGLDPTLIGPDRLLALAEPALGEACGPLRDAPGTPRQLPLYLGMAEFRPGFSERDVKQITHGLGQIVGLPTTLSVASVFTEGHAAGLSALKMAVDQIQQEACEACLVGGVDSYFHPDTIAWLDQNRQLASTTARSAFMPGEGAGFCLLMAEHAWKRLGLTPLARVLGVSVGREAKLIKTPAVCLGEGLTDTVRRAVESLRAPPAMINDVICDINGERYRGEEWGFVCLRLSQYFDDPTSYQSPAVCWGDMGAASGPLFAMLACQAAVRRYAKGPRTLVWASSEGGLRAAAVLDTGDPS